jgi:hypothetical protein
MKRLKYLGGQRKFWRNAETSHLYKFGPHKRVRFVDSHDVKWFMSQRDAGGSPLFAEVA